MIDFYTLFKLNLKLINLGGIIKTFVYYFRNRDYFSYVKRNKELFTKKKNATCYICALGPSLKQVNFNNLRGDTIVVNRFFKMGKELTNFIPTYYLIIDALFCKEENLEDFYEALEQYKGKGTAYLLHSKLANIAKT